MKSRTLGRRSFLRGAGKMALALPLLSSLGPRSVWGQETPIRRLIFFFTPNGIVMDSWRPSGTETNFTLSPILEPLAVHQSDLLILDGIDLESSYHGPGAAHQAGIAHLLTGIEAQEGDLFDAGGNTGKMGWAGGKSVDQTVADFIGDQTRFRSLEFGVRTTVSQILTRLNYRGPGQPIPPEFDPYAMFGRLFGMDGVDPETLTGIHARRKSVIDFVLEDYQQLSGRLGAHDRSKLEAHLSAIRQVEQSLIPSGDPGEGTMCQHPELGMVYQLGAQQNVPMLGRQHMDLLIQALACDLTRVATLQWVSPVKSTVYSWLGQTTDHHSLTHRPLSDTAAQNQLTAINRWYAEQLDYLITSLKAIPEGEGTLFDHTAIVWCSEVSHGNVHERRDMPFVIAGTGAGHFRSGRYLTYSSGCTPTEGLTSASCTPHNDLLVSLMNYMGVPGETFGNPAYCNGPLYGLT